MLVQKLYFIFSQHFIFVDGHVFVEGHLCSNNSITVGTGVTETVGEMSALNVFSDIGFWTMGEFLANAAGLSSVCFHYVLFEILGAL